MNDNLNCPACGAPIEGVSPLIRSISCAHCSNLLYFNNSAWVDGGRFPTQIEAPPLLHTEKRGKISNEAFVVAGRVRLSYDGGHWDEWWLEFENGNDRWLEEDDGNYKLHQSIPVSVQVKDVQHLAVGQMFNANNQNWFITDGGEASVTGVQGQVPVTLRPGFKLRYFDAVTGGKTLSIEVWDDEVEASMAHAANLSSIVWDN